jgi:hypothetical protein
MSFTTLNKESPILIGEAWVILFWVIGKKFPFWTPYSVLLATF